MSFGPKSFVTLVILALAVFMRDAGLGAQENQPRHEIDWDTFSDIKKRSERLVLEYRCSRGHFGGRITDSNIDEVFVWKDGMIVWSVAKEKEPRPDLFYKSSIPPEKVETVVKEIAEDFAEYPSQKRPWMASIIFRIDASYSPSVEVSSPSHSEFMWMDNILWEFYKENRKVLRSDDKDAIIKTIKKVSGIPLGKVDADGKYTGIHPAWTFDYKGLVNHYEREQSQDKKAETRKTEFTDEEILRAVAFFVADAEHLLLMEKKILDLIPFRDGLKAKELETVPPENNEKSSHKK